MKPCTDPAEIRRIACHPHVWPGFGGTQSPEGWEPPLQDGVHWLTSEGVIVVFTRMRHNTYEAHIGALPGHRAKPDALAAMGWLKAHTGALYLLGYIPQSNYRALVNARAVGMRELTRFADQIMVGKEL